MIPNRKEFFLAAAKIWFANEAQENENGDIRPLTVELVATLMDNGAFLYEQEKEKKR